MKIRSIQGEKKNYFLIICLVVCTTDAVSKNGQTGSV